MKGSEEKWRELITCDVSPVAMFIRYPLDIYYKGKYFMCLAWFVKCDRSSLCRCLLIFRSNLWIYRVLCANTNRRMSHHICQQSFWKTIFLDILPLCLLQSTGKQLEFQKNALDQKGGRGSANYWTFSYFEKQNISLINSFTP